LEAAAWDVPTLEAAAWAVPMRAQIIHDVRRSIVALHEKIMREWENKRLRWPKEVRGWKGASFVDCRAMLCCVGSDLDQKGRIEFREHRTQKRVCDSHSTQRSYHTTVYHSTYVHTCVLYCSTYHSASFLPK
jgi:hypothetical protein